MRLITFKQDGAQRIGAWIDGDSLIVDLAAAAAELGLTRLAAASGDMVALIAGGEPAWEEARQAIAKRPTAATLATADCTILAPMPQPPQIRDFITFEQHLLNGFAASKQIRANLADDPVAEMERIEREGVFAIPAVWYQRPLYYITNRLSIVGPDVDIEWPAYSDVIDYELELAVVIGNPGKDIAREDARKHIFGFTIFNDFSARDEQMIVMEGKLGPGKGKEFDNGNGLGPCIVTLDEIGDYDNLRMRARVDGEQWSEGNSSAMHWKFDDLIAYMSKSQTLLPGEVLCSGTVGTGCGAEQMRFPQDGAVIELEIEKIGILRNRVFKHRG